MTVTIKVDKNRFEVITDAERYQWLKENNMINQFHVDQSILKSRAPVIISKTYTPIYRSSIGIDYRTLELCINNTTHVGRIAILRRDHYSDGTSKCELINE